MKPKSIPPFVLIILLACSTVATLRAASYSEAVFTRLEKEVKVLKENSPPREATLGEQLKAVTSVATGMSSRAELRFPDKTLTRLGANSRFTLRGDARTLDLNEGVMMLSVPKRMGGAKIRTSAVTAALTGTTVEFEFSAIVDKKTHKKKEILKMIVVEGSVDLFRTHKPRDFITVPEGKMIIMDPNGPWQALVDVDIKRLRKTSPLLNEDDGPLPTSDHINDSVKAQQAKLGSGELIKTSLMIPGRGTQVSIITNTALNAIQTNVLQNANVIPVAGDGVIVKNIQPPTNGFGQIPGFSVLNNTSIIKTDPFVTSWNSLKNGDLTSQGAIYRGPVDGAFSTFAFGDIAIPSVKANQAVAGIGDTAVFRFEDLIVNGSPVFDLSAPTPAQVVTKVILAADNNIAIGPDNTFASSPHPGGTSPVSAEASLDVPASLRFLAFWSNQGSIHLKPGFNINMGNALSITNPGLAFVAAGPQSDVTIEGSIHAYSGSFAAGLAVEASRDVNVLGGNIIQDGPNNAVDMHAGRKLAVNGSSIMANRVYLGSGNGTTINNSILASTSNDIFQNGIEINGGAGGITVTNSAVSDQSRGIYLHADKDIVFNISNSSQFQALSTDTNAFLHIHSYKGNISVTGNGGGNSAPDTLFSGNSIELLAHKGNVTLTNMVATANNVRINAGSSVPSVVNGSITATNANITANAPAVPPAVNHGIDLVATSDITINITDSSQLRVLANDPGAVLRLFASQGNVNVTGNGGGPTDADTLHSNNDILIEAPLGNVTLTNMVATAQNAFRARANGPNGVLTVSGSTINAGNLIRLYAEGATGGILFIGNVRLSTAGAVQISGNSVRVQSGGSVNIPTGTADIFSNNHDYELNLPGNATHGSINGPSITPRAGTGLRPPF